VSDAEKNKAEHYKVPKGTYYQKIVVLFKDFLEMGLTPDAVALGVSVGIVVGVFPFLGLTTLLAAVIVLILRLNMPLVQAVNYLMAPIHILMIVPWIRAGEYVFGRARGPLTAKETIFLIQHKPWIALEAIWWDILRAVGAWCLAAPFLILIFYWILKPISHRIAAKLK
jgi:hypothetical protein